MKGDLHGRSLFSLYSRILHPARMHFGPFLNHPLELEHYQNHPRSPSNLNRKVSSTHVAAMPWTLAIFLPSIPSCYLCAINSNGVVCASCMSWTRQCQLLFHATEAPIKRDGWLCPAPPDRSKRQPCFAAPPLLHRVAREEGEQ